MLGQWDKQLVWITSPPESSSAKRTPRQIQEALVPFFISIKEFIRFLSTRSPVTTLVPVECGTYGHSCKHYKRGCSDCE
ncbi:homeobox protein Hox-C4 isoform X4 [Bufo gargarizans]|uniref:homeobox protein Hox-C4 isoform X4 n=1 Tax=Bufo gargarizans TaxID=30331 RepID=UPI001CF39781|nr:homeobox protein Hox-C4 isoform X4 [Bufo gargarizans]